MSHSAANDIIKLFKNSHANRKANKRYGRVHGSRKRVLLNEIELLPSKFQKIQSKIDNQLSVNYTVHDDGFQIKQTVLHLEPYKGVEFPPIKLAYQDPTAYMSSIPKEYFVEDIILTPDHDFEEYDDINTGARSIEVQRKIRSIFKRESKVYLLGGIHYTDASTTGHMGQRKAQPFTFTVSILKRHLRNKGMTLLCLLLSYFDIFLVCWPTVSVVLIWSDAAKHLFCYLPTEWKLEGSHTKDIETYHARAVKYEVTSFCFMLMSPWTRPFKWEFAYRKPVLRNGIKRTSETFTFVYAPLLYILDYPEAQLVAGMYASTKARQPCRYCDCSADDLWDTNLSHFTARDFEAVNDHLWCVTKLQAKLQQTDKKSTQNLMKRKNSEANDWLHERSIRPEFTGGHAAYRLGDQDHLMNHDIFRLGCAPATRIPFEVMHAYALGICESVVSNVYLALGKEALRKAGRNHREVVHTFNSRIASFHSVKLNEKGILSVFLLAVSVI